MKINDDFISVARANNRSIKNNSNFKLIEQLIEENANLITQSGFECVRIEPENGCAYLFKMPTPPATVFFSEQGFVFVERHLRVDQYYSLPTSAKGQQGFSAAHYTENYRHPESGEKITTHLYFSGTVQYVQIKKTSADGAVELIDERAIIMAIQLNGFEAHCFYQKIEKEKNKRYFAALSSADQAERKIKKLHCAFSTAAQIQQYVQIADEFCVLIDRVNFYNELATDCRGELIQRTKKTLLQKLESVMANRVPEVAPVQSQSPKDEGTLAPKEEILSSQQNQSKPQVVIVHEPDAFQNIEQLAAKLNRCVRDINPKSIVSAYEIVDQLREALLLYSIPKKSKSKQAIKNKIMAIEEQIQSLPDVGKYAKEAALKGKHDTIAILFKLLSFDQQIAILTDLYTALLTDDIEDNSKLAQQLRSICEYFNKNSNYYAAFVTKQSLTLFFAASVECGFSFLFKAAFKNKKSTFDMFLQHGMDPNSVGYFVEHLPFSNLKIFAHLIPDPYYSRCLIEYGATLNAPSKYLSYDAKSVSYRVVSKDQMPHQVRSGKLEERKIYSEIAEISDLSSACAGLNFTAIPAFLDHCDITVKAHAFARAMNIQGFMRRVIPYSTEPGVFLCNSLAEADDLRSKIYFKNPEHLNVAIIFYPIDASSKLAKNIPVIKTMLDSIKTFCQAHLTEIPHYVDMLEAAAKNANLQKDIFYVASLILYSLKINTARSKPEQYIMNRQRLMHLFCTLGNIMQQQLEVERSLDSYKSAVLLGGDVPSLKCTPLYEYACKKMREVELKISLGLSRSRVPITFSFQNDTQVSHSSQNGPK